MTKIGVISKWITQKSRVLVLGCGSGELIKELTARNRIAGSGIDIDEQRVCEAISGGLSVIQGDINTDLEDWPKKTFDFVIAHDIVQIMNKPDVTIRQMVGLGRKVIISFPNFAYCQIRFSILFSGRMPKTKLLPYEWYDTPNIHLFTIKDFKDFCSKENIFIHRQTFTGLGKKNIPECLQPDFFAEFAYFLISDKKESAP